LISKGTVEPYARSGDDDDDNSLPLLIFDPCDNTAPRFYDYFLSS